MASVFDQPVPETVKEKKQLLLSHRIALWDVIASCSICGSSDASIRNVVVNDLTGLIAGSSISAVICNGQAAGRLYKKYAQARTGIEALVLPSTSPANASWSLERLIEVWKPVLTGAAC